MIKEMYPTWTDEDAVFALQECDGDLELAVERITDGQYSLLRAALLYRATVYGL